MDMYSTAFMAALVRRLKRPTSFLLDTFFPTIYTFDTDEVAFDVEEEFELAVPFCSPLSEGTPMRQRGFEAKSIRPPYLKPKTTLDPTKHTKRLAGEVIGGDPTMSAAERAEARLLEALEDHVEGIVRRKEAMAGELLATGKLIIESEKYPRSELDYGRDVTLSPILPNGQKWTDSGISPYDSTQKFMNDIFKASGAIPTDLVFTGDAFDLFWNDPKTKERINNDFRGGASAIEGVKGIQNGAVLQGVLGLNGTRLWHYQGRYRDPVTKQYVNNLPDHGLLAASKDAGGMQLFGAIVDDDIAESTGQAGPVRGEMVSKSWTQKDPGVRYIMTQSAFVPGLGRPDATGFMIVK